MKISMNSFHRYDVPGIDDPEKRGIKGYKCKWIGWILEHIFCKAVSVKTDQGTFYFNRKSYIHWKRRTLALKPIAPPLPVGFKNVGNSCYLNAILQILFHIPEVRDIILKKENHPIVNLLKDLLKRNSPSEPILRNLQDQTFHSKEQQDVHEAFMLLTEHLNWLPLKMVSYFRSGNINQPAGPEEKTNHLSLAIPETKAPFDPQEVICNFFREEPLEGEVAVPINGIFHKSDQWKKQIQVTAFPTYFLLQLNRFNYERAKVESSVVLKDLLWLPGKEGKVDYEVVGYVNHHGSSLDEGHYTADLKVGDSWFRYDDSYVTSQNLPAVSKDVYLILLRKRPS